MKSYLQELENNEAILLLYLNDELPPEDRAEVEQMLASDAGLRDLLEGMRLTQQAGLAALAGLDTASRLPVSEAVAVRQIVRQMNRRKLEKKAQPVEPAKVWKYPWWGYALPAAAASIILFVMWTAYRAVPSVPAALTPNNAVAHVLTPSEKFALLHGSFDMSAPDEDTANVQLAAVAKTEDGDLGLDPTRAADANSQNSQ